MHFDAMPYDSQNCYLSISSLRFSNLVEADLGEFGQIDANLTGDARVDPTKGAIVYDANRFVSGACNLGREGDGSARCARWQQRAKGTRWRLPIPDVQAHPWLLARPRRPLPPLLCQQTGGSLEWTIVETYGIGVNFSGVNGGNDNEVQIHIHFKRKAGFYEKYVMMPVYLLVVAAYLSLFVQRGVAPARVSLSITAYLTLTSIVNSVQVARACRGTGVCGTRPHCSQHVARPSCSRLYPTDGRAALSHALPRAARCLRRPSRRLSTRSIFSTFALFPPFSYSSLSASAPRQAARRPAAPPTTVALVCKDLRAHLILPTRVRTGTSSPTICYAARVGSTRPSPLSRPHIQLGGRKRNSSTVWKW